MNKNEFKKYKLSDVSQFTYGKMPIKEKILLEGNPIFSGYRVVGYYPEYMYDEEKLIVIARGVGGVGKVRISPKKSYITNLSIIFIEYKDKVYYKYLYYYLSDRSLRTLDTGSCQSQITVNQLEEKIIFLPSLSIQFQISRILSVLDAKIELNNKINQELEVMAKTLYDYWFVQFDFPDENGKPYKSSGGKMIYNEELKREIPEGWEVSTFGDYSNVKSGFAFKSTWWQVIGVPVLKIKDIQEDYTLNLNNFSFVASDKIEMAKRFESKAGDVVIAMTGATIGKFAMIPYTNKSILVNQRVGLYDLGNEPFFKLPYLLNSMKQDFFRGKVLQIAGGAAQANISGEQLDNFPLYKQNNELIKLFNNKFKSTYQQIANNIAKNQKLVELRDWLLPMLMNGQVTVK